MEQLQLSRPIFVGGTGRSGTSIMAKMLNSHPSIVLPCHENKLICEVYGLIDLVNELSRGFDFKRNHRTIANFAWWADTLREFGFRDRKIRLTVQAIEGLLNRIGRNTVGLETKIAKRFPKLKYSLHSNGEGFGLEHYDACVDRLMGRILAKIDETGILDTEGVISPYYFAATFERDLLLHYCREFLRELYQKPVAEQQGTRWCDDTPVNILNGKFLLELYPEMKLIHMVRDPRDVLYSYLEQPWVSGNFETTLLGLKNYYTSIMRAESEMSDRHYIRVQLEDFVSSHTDSVKKISEFIEVDLAGFDFENRLESKSLGRGKKNFDDNRLAQIASELAEVMDEYGYK